MKITAPGANRTYERSLIEASIDPLFAIISGGKITDVNEATVKITGITKDDLTGTDFCNYFTEPEKARQFYQQVFEKGFVSNYPLFINHADGNEIALHFNASLYRDEKGKVSGIVATGRDVTEYHQRKVKLKMMNSDQEQRIADLEAFSYSVSHDLKAPLRVLNGFIGMFLDKYNNDVDDEGKRMLGIIRNNVTKMENLIIELLRLSKIGTKEMHFTPINMKTLAMTALEELDKIKGNAIITVKELDNATGDIELIRQVLVNLLSNAFKFSNKNEQQEIEIGSIPHKSEVHYYVKDKGVGFDMEYATKLFGVFQRLHNPKDYQGSGVGLATVKRIIMRHQGKVWAEGKKNEGATFFFSLKKF